MSNSLLLILALCLMACGKTPDQSSLNLTNAIAIESSIYPAVIQLLTDNQGKPGYCTGFFVNEHQVLTAAHCVGDRSQRTEVYMLTDQQKGARALRFHLPMDGTRTLSTDLAILDFPAGSAKAALRLSARLPAISDTVTLVGYGREQNLAGASPTEAGSDPGIKRYGQNSIAGIAEGIISLVGLARAKAGIQQGQYVATAQGDSGGPLLLNNEVVGMTVAGEVRQGPNGQLSSVTYAVDLNSVASREFLENTLD